MVRHTHTIETWVGDVVQVLPDSLDRMAFGHSGYQHTNGREAHETYGGIWTKASAPRVLSAGPHTASISFVSDSIQVATEGSTKSETGCELAPSETPAVKYAGSGCHGDSDHRHVPRESKAQIISAGWRSTGVN
jgi:hypothetical protein